MINRVLIRIKVVQLLYSYLLVENQFNLESQPSSPTREKRFAYGLYLDMLYLMTRIASGVTYRGKEGPLSETRFIRRISADDRLRSLAHKYSAGGFPFESVVAPLSDAVRESALYKRYKKSENPGSLADEVIWKDIFKLIIMTSPEVNAIISGIENYSLSGVDRMQRMIEGTFTNFFVAGDHLPDALRTLAMSMDKARELYFRLLYLPVELTAMREADIEEARNKYVLTDEDRNPNLRFVENQLVERLASNELIYNETANAGKTWANDNEPMLRSLLKAIMASDIYKEYMEFPATDFQNDCDLWRNLFKQVIFGNPDFLEALEDKSVFWNDDVDIIGTFMLKTLKKFSDGELDPIMPKFKDEEDARFGAELFTSVIKNKDDYRMVLEETINRDLWDTERLAYMDVVVVLTAMAEMLNFPKIPLTVTINEYVEIAKSYSTAKSAQFVNGLIRSIIERLKADGKLFK